MAGATKLIGFDFNGGKIYLERWGKKAEVEIPLTAVDSIRTVCHKQLPTQPPKELLGDWATTRYDDALQNVIIGMTPDTCKRLAAYLKESYDSLLTDLGEDLEKRLEEHKTLRDPKGEPGIDG